MTDHIESSDTAQGSATNTKMAQRLQAKVRNSLLDSVETLNAARRKAKAENNSELAKQYAAKIETILDQLDDMSDVGLAQLNNDPETTQTIAELNAISDALENSAGEMKNVTDKLKKATELINTATQFATKITTLLA